MRADPKPLYQYCGAALLRAAARPLDDAAGDWPDPSDPQSCRAWPTQAWAHPDLIDAVRLASPTLADRLDAVCGGKAVQDKQVRRATLALVRYVLRATGRYTPFGLFSGVAPASVGNDARVRWGDGHRPFARVDTQWLADVVDQLEACPELLERLDVVFTNLAVQRGTRLEVPRGPNRVTIRFTAAVRAVRAIAGTPIRFGDLADKLAATFNAADPATIRAMLTELVRQGVLITCLRAPLTVPDPLTELINQLNEVKADTIADAAWMSGELRDIHADLHHHNQSDIPAAWRSRVRTTITSRMCELSRAGRTPLAVDLLLDCEVSLPAHVCGEMEAAADALARLTRQPTGPAAWRDYYTAFSERYGTGTLVPLLDVVDPDAGLGFPAGYPGSVFPSRTSSGSERDEKLLALAWNALAGGSAEIVLDDQTIDALAVGDPATQMHVPPHVELAARIQATSTQALERGDYLLTVVPARSVGTFSSRFTMITTESSFENVYAAVPTAVIGALPVQTSFPPVYPHAENICRVPAYLPHVLSFGEHRRHDAGTIMLNDLAITATRDGLHLVSISRRQVVEPQVFHGLALEKQPPPLARFLIHLSRGVGPSWHKFDWGPHTQRLPYLPRVRYGRAILAPGRWRLTTNDLPTDLELDQWRQALDRWRHRWRCPGMVELSDADRSLRLDLDERAHVAILGAHLQRHGHVTLTDSVATAADYGWIDGHAHEVVLPMITTCPPQPVGRRRSRPRGPLPTPGTARRVGLDRTPPKRDRRRPMTQVEPSSPPVAGAAPGDSLADGAAGIALLHIERARAGDTTWYNAQVWASAVTRGPVTAHPDIAGLYRGVPAVAFTLHAAGLPCYAPALDTLDGHIATLTRHRLARAHQRIDSGLLPALREYDLISGLTGIGAYLLHRGRDIELLGDVLIYLVRLTEPVLADGDMLPGWWCRDSPADQPADRWSGGHGNLGIAHGIAGPLALLSTATRRGVSVPGQTEAIERILAWLERWCVGTGRQSWWPGRITAAEQRSGTTAQRGRNGRLGATARRAWCAPGNSPRWP